MNSFKNLTVLVTGGSSGIGKAIARELAAQGSDLILVSRNAERLEQEAEDLKVRFGAVVHVFPADLSLSENCAALFRRVQEMGLTVDILVNNAGLGYYGAFGDVRIEDTSAMLDLNVHALTHLTQLFLPGMLERKSGGILNVASIAGFQPVPYLAVYAATKAFVLNLSEALWAECKDRGVRVFCLCPGNTLTRFHQSAGIGRRSMLFSASAVDVARFALRKFLKTDQPSAVYGLWNKLMMLSEKVAPRRLIIFFTGMIYQPGPKLKEQSSK